MPTAQHSSAAERNRQPIRACCAALLSQRFNPCFCPMTSALSPLCAPFFTARTADGQQCDAWPDQPLLASLEQGGLDWPSSCRNGTCRTCIGQLRTGTVRYEIEWPGLSAEELAQGCVLPCVAYPLSDLLLEKVAG